MSQTQVDVRGEVSWPGLSGAKYKFAVYSLPFNCNANQLGNYIFAKQVYGTWYAVYIGEGDLNVRCNERQHFDCAVAKGATHLHCHVEPNEKARKAEEADLLGGSPEAYLPYGCNQKMGG